MNREDTLRLDGQLCFLLYATTRAVTQAYAPLLEPLGLTYPQYLTMLALWEEDGVPVGRLGERLRLDSGTLTPLLKRLEGMALVERRRSPSDERVVHVHLSARRPPLARQGRRRPQRHVLRHGPVPGRRRTPGRGVAPLLAALGPTLDPEPTTTSATNKKEPQT